MSDEHAPNAGIEAQLGGIAARLLDVAGCVASESETATAMIRGMADQASRIAMLSAALEHAASVMEANVRRQAETLADARHTLATNAPVVAALARSVDGVASISATIAEIARESRILSLNARIEAARAGRDGRAFAVIAREMETLTDRTSSANAEVGERSRSIAQDVGSANDVVAAHGALVVEQDELLATSLESAGRQRDIAAELAGITAETVGTVDAAAAAIGRVGANAVAVKVLARQVAKLARRS